MSTTVYVTGTGIISAIGNTVAETIQSFETHTSGIGQAKYLPTLHQEFPLGEVKLSNEALAQHNQLNPNLSRTILLSSHAVKEALLGLSKNKLDTLRTGFISSNSVGGMDKTESFFEDFSTDSTSGDLHKVVNHDCGKATDYVAQQFGLNGFITTISTACSSSANAIMLGSRLIKSGQLDVVIAGGVDSLTKFTLNGFNSLMIVDKEQCRPLDKTRAGLNLGEGAAYLVLMNEKAVKVFNSEILCTVSGYCNTNDAHHQTALSDEGNGPYLAMEGALRMSGLQPSDIDYINMHGTGTQNNDSAEGKAVTRIFHPNYPMLSSTKSFTGHTLGASGAIEAVLSALAIRHSFVYPNFSFTESVDGLELQPERTFKKNIPLKHILSNSFGFGGNCTSLIFSKS